MSKRALLMNKSDNVATVIDAVTKGEVVAILFNGQVVGTLHSLSDIDHYHKLALQTINKDDDVCKYGEVIGKCTQPIQRGEHVHVSNIESVMTI